MFTMTVETDNDAFVVGGAGELARILSTVAQRVADGETSGSVRDACGNTVGTWAVAR